MSKLGKKVQRRFNRAGIVAAVLFVSWLLYLYFTARGVEQTPGALVWALLPGGLIWFAFYALGGAVRWFVEFLE